MVLTLILPPTLCHWLRYLSPRRSRCKDQVVPTGAVRGNEREHVEPDRRPARAHRHLLRMRRLHVDAVAGLAARLGRGRRPDLLQPSPRGTGDPGLPSGGIAVTSRRDISGLLAYWDRTAPLPPPSVSTSESPAKIAREVRLRTEAARQVEESRRERGADLSMPMLDLWPGQLVKTTPFDQERRAPADRHYSRRTRGARQFAYRGRNSCCVTRQAMSCGCGI